MMQLTVSQRKREHQEIYAAELTILSYLDWSEETIMFDCNDHPDHILSPEHYPLVVNPIISNTLLTKVLMDGGSGHNMLCAETLDHSTTLCNQ